MHACTHIYRNIDIQVCTYRHIHIYIYMHGHYPGNVSAPGNKISAGYRNLNSIPVKYSKISQIQAF